MQYAVGDIIIQMMVAKGFRLWEVKMVERSGNVYQLQCSYVSHTDDVANVNDIIRVTAADIDNSPNWVMSTTGCGGDCGGSCPEPCDDCECETEPPCTCSSRDLATVGCKCAYAAWKVRQS